MRVVLRPAREVKVRTGSGCGVARTWLKELSLVPLNGSALEDGVELDRAVPSPMSLWIVLRNSWWNVLCSAASDTR
jgi:hypothetical protein